MLHQRVAPLIARYGLTPDHRTFRARDATQVGAAEVLQPTLF
jgi:hypothetical protein